MYPETDNHKSRTWTGSVHPCIVKKLQAGQGDTYLQSCGLMGGERRDFIVSAVESVRKLCGAIQYTHLSVADIQSSNLSGTLQTTPNSQKRGLNVYFLYRNIKAYFCGMFYTSAAPDSSFFYFHVNICSYKLILCNST